MVGGVARLVRNGLQDQFDILKAHAEVWKRCTIVEVKRQVIDTSITAGIAFLGVFLGFLTIIVGLIALYAWVAAHEGPFVAFAVVGGTTSSLAILMFLIAMMRAQRGRADATEPSPYTAKIVGTAKASLSDAVKHDAARTASAASEAVRAAANALGNSSREAFLTTLALAIFAGFVAGRRVRRPSQH